MQTLDASLKLGPTKISQIISLFIYNYQLFRNDRSREEGMRGGGVAMYVNHSMQAKRRTDPEKEEF
jgi:hypothetical protein